eukprot:gnl/MRDRNA2_/MRDRNA2_19698_c0_seq1.p1 gnl/MRDRNA2_/MRDRNA2_19698_c0~~gnl/MRDRNA2_/MRDRNA2_19698_c0_seq1.p1  ORF type:complete len:480 (+),score=52.20 gnl/MRDRNA2_/MRDRNA2_19698_c0_seq1:162-1601(+)
MGIAEQLLGGPVNDKRIVWFFTICAAQSLGWAVFGILASFFAMSVGVRAFGLGISWALNEGAQLVSAPLLGRLSDAIGRKLIIIFCFTWTSTIVGINAFITTAWGYIVCRAVSGLGQPSVSILAAVLTDIIPENERSSRFGSFGAVPFMVGVLGAGLGSLLIICGLEIWQAILVSCVFMFISVILTILLLPETLDRSLRRPLCGVGGAGSARRNLEDGLPSPTDAAKLHSLMNAGLLLVWISRATSSFAIVSWMLTYPYLIKDAFGWGPSEFGFIVMVLCLVVGAAQNWMFPRMDKALGCHVTTGLGQLMLIPGLCLMPISVDPKVTSDLNLRLTFHGFVMVWAALTFAIVEVSIPRIVAAYVPEPGLMGLAQGGTSSFRSMGFILGSLISGLVYDWWGMYGPYLIGASCSVIGTLAVFGAWKFGDVHEDTPEAVNSNSKTPSAAHSPLRGSARNFSRRESARGTPDRDRTPPRYQAMS